MRVRVRVRVRSSPIHIILLDLFMRPFTMPLKPIPSLTLISNADLTWEIT
jgi:hypothetical protein